MTPSEDVRRAVSGAATWRQLGMLVVHALGGAEIRAGHVRIRPTSAKKFAFVLFLAFESGRRVPRSVLQELLFPDADDKSAAHALRELIYQLRHANVPLQTDKASVGLPAEAVRSDFSEVIAAERLDVSQVRAVEGGLLPGYAPSFSQPFSEWLDGARATTTSAMCRVLLRDLAHAKASGEWSRMESLARACRAIDPLNEDATLALAQAFAVTGSKARALEVLDRYNKEVGNDQELVRSTELLKRRISDGGAPVRDAPEMLFVGRQNEMLTIDGALNASKETATPRIVALSGEPGVGKTRIATEAANAAKLDGWLAFRVAPQPGDESRPLGAFVDITAWLLKQRGALGCAPESLDCLRRLFRVDPTDTPPLADSGEFAVARAIRDLVDAVCAERPLLLVVDDVQWADRESLRLVRELTHTSDKRRLLFLLAARTSSAIDAPEFSPRATTRIAVEPLSESAVRSLVEPRLGDVSDDGLVAWMVEIARGNPFFVDCLVHHVQTTGERFVVPSRLSELIDRRIRALSANANTALNVVIRLGRWATTERLRAVLEIPFRDVASAIAELEAQELIVVGERVEAVHALVSESALRLSTSGATKMIHGRIAEVLEEESQEDPDPALLWDLSAHLVASGRGHYAAEVMVRCAEHALQLGRQRDAAEHYLRAADVCRSADRAGHLIAAARSANGSSEMDVVLRAVSLLGEIQSDVPSDLRTAQLMARFGIEGNFRTVLPDLREFFANCSHSVESRLATAIAFIIACDNERYVDLIDEARADIYDLIASHSGPSLTALRAQIVLECSFGDLHAAARAAERLLSVVDSVPTNHRAMPLRFAAVALHRIGRVAESRSVMLRSYREAKEIGFSRAANYAAGMLSELFNNEMDYLRADQWHDIAESAAWVAYSSDTRIAQNARKVDRAFSRGDSSTLLESRDWDDDTDVELKGRRTTNFMSAFRLYVRHKRGEDIDLDAVLADTYSSLSPNGEHGDSNDCRIAMLAAILIERSHVSEAHGMMSAYIHEYRRHGPPLEISLLMVLATTCNSARLAWTRRAGAMQASQGDANPARDRSCAPCSEVEA